MYLCLKILDQLNYSRLWNWNFTTVCNCTNTHHVVPIQFLGVLHSAFLWAYRHNSKAMDMNQQFNDTEVITQIIQQEIGNDLHEGTTIMVWRLNSQIAVTLKHSTINVFEK